MPPIKNVNKYSQLLTNNSKVGQRQQQGQRQLQGYGPQGQQGQGGQYNINNNMYGRPNMDTNLNIGNTHL